MYTQPDKIKRSATVMHRIKRRILRPDNTFLVAFHCFRERTVRETEMIHYTVFALATLLNGYCIKVGSTELEFSRT